VPPVLKNQAGTWGKVSSEMGDDRRVRCTKCGGHVSEVGGISWSGQCVQCWNESLVSNVHQMRTRSGPNWKKWRRSMAASVGGVLLDDSPQRP
jgi:hypothetical protein